jgi:hypothetical protein
MPEASIDKDCNAISWEYEVWPAEQRHMPTPTCQAVNPKD